MENLIILSYIIFIFIVIESICQIIIKFVNKKFQWLIIEKDEYPKFSDVGLKKFFQHGYDEELGWIRKPKTSHKENGKEGMVEWHTNEKGARVNPEFENKESIISCYGDSFTFARQVSDDETWEHYLSKLVNSNVQNFGVGNYGIDQSLIRMKREYPLNSTKIVILAVVPDTISRIMSMWKHYYEYGNTFAFKPKFILENGNLKLINNQINNKSKFNEYKKFLPEIKKYDYFYSKKFRKEKLHFPYFLTAINNPKRSFGIVFRVILREIMKKNGKNVKKMEWNLMKIIMEINLKWRLKLFNDNNATKLLYEILQEFVKFSEKNNFKPVFIFLPQKDDLIFIQNKYNFLEKFITKINSLKKLNYIDIIKEFSEIQDLDFLYSDDNEYGGHFSKEGNEKVAVIIQKKLNELGFLSEIEK